MSDQADIINNNKPVKVGKRQTKSLSLDFGRTIAQSDSTPSFIGDMTGGTIESDHGDIYNLVYQADTDETTTDTPIPAGTRWTLFDEHHSILSKGEVSLSGGGGGDGDPVLHVDADFNNQTRNLHIAVENSGRATADVNIPVYGNEGEVIITGSDGVSVTEPRPNQFWIQAVGNPSDQSILATPAGLTVNPAEGLKNTGHGLAVAVDNVNPNALEVTAYGLLVPANTGGGLPTGGETGEVLTKRSAADDDVDWEAPAGDPIKHIDVDFLPLERELYISVENSGGAQAHVNIPDNARDVVGGRGIEVDDNIPELYAVNVNIADSSLSASSAEGLKVRLDSDSSNTLEVRTDGLYSSGGQGAPIVAGGGIDIDDATGDRVISVKLGDSSVKYSDDVNSGLEVRLSEDETNALQLMPAGLFVASGDGPSGPPGAPGTDGKDGAPGTDGKDGAAATIKVGDVSTVNYEDGASVSNAGTETQAVFDFAIPRGQQGAQGIDGKQGEQGARGEDGTDGKDGKDGEQGAKGEKGDKGDQGADGQGVPAGGFTGQILAKTNEQDFNTHWIDNTGGGGGLDYVRHDASLTGDGTSDSPLKVSHPAENWGLEDVLGVQDWANGHPIELTQINYGNATARYTPTGTDLEITSAGDERTRGGTILDRDQGAFQFAETSDHQLAGNPTARMQIHSDRTGSTLTAVNKIVDDQDNRVHIDTDLHMMNGRRIISDDSINSDLNIVKQTLERPGVSTYSQTRQAGDLTDIVVQIVATQTLSNFRASISVADTYEDSWYSVATVESDNDYVNGLILQGSRRTYWATGTGAQKYSTRFINSSREVVEVNSVDVNHFVLVMTDAHPTFIFDVDISDGFDEATIIGDTRTRLAFVHSSSDHIGVTTPNGVMKQLAWTDDHPQGSDPIDRLDGSFDQATNNLTLTVGNSGEATANIYIPTGEGGKDVKGGEGMKTRDVDNIRYIEPLLEGDGARTLYADATGMGVRKSGNADNILEVVEDGLFVHAPNKESLIKYFGYRNGEGLVIVLNGDTTDDFVCVLTTADVTASEIIDGEIMVTTQGLVTFYYLPADTSFFTGAAIVEKDQQQIGVPLNFKATLDFVRITTNEPIDTSGLLGRISNNHYIGKGDLTDTFEIVSIENEYPHSYVVQSVLTPALTNNGKITDWTLANSDNFVCIKGSQVIGEVLKWDSVIASAARY